jgi:hypothetical protein
MCAMEVAAVSEQTPSQAEGERDGKAEDLAPSDGSRDAPPNPRTTPSQAEGDRDDEE